MSENRLTKQEALARYSNDKVFQMHVNAIIYMRSVHSLQEIIAITALAEDMVQARLREAKENEEKGRVLLVDGRGNKIN